MNFNGYFLLYLLQPAKSQGSGFPEKSSDIPKVLKNDSNRFWPFVEGYCADITSDDAKVWILVKDLYHCIIYLSTIFFAYYL